MKPHMEGKKDRKPASTKHLCINERIWQELNEHAQQLSTDQRDETQRLSRTEFMDTMDRMERYQVAGPTEHQTKQLLAALTARMEKKQDEQPTREETPFHDDQHPFWLRLTRSLISQVQLFTPLFWIVSLIVMGLGAMLMYYFDRGELNVFIISSSLVAGLSVFYALRSSGTPMARLEATFPISPLEIAMGRISIILVYDILLGLLLSIGFSFSGITGPLLSFIISWLVPLCLCVILSFVLITGWGPWVGALVLMLFWGSQLTFGKLLGPFFLMSDVSYPYWGMSRLIGCVLTVGLMVVAYLILRQSYHMGDEADGSKA